MGEKKKKTHVCDLVGDVDAQAKAGDEDQDREDLPGRVELYDGRGAEDPDADGPDREQHDEDDAGQNAVGDEDPAPTLGSGRGRLRQGTTLDDGRVRLGGERVCRVVVPRGGEVKVEGTNVAVPTYAGGRVVGVEGLARVVGVDPAARGGREVHRSAGPGPTARA